MLFLLIVPVYACRCRKLSFPVWPLMCTEKRWTLVRVHWCIFVLDRSLYRLGQYSSLVSNCIMYFYSDTLAGFADFVVTDRVQLSHLFLFMYVCVITLALLTVHHFAAGIVAYSRFLPTGNCLKTALVHCTEPQSSIWCSESVGLNPIKLVCEWPRLVRQPSQFNRLFL